MRRTLTLISIFALLMSLLALPAGGSTLPNSLDWDGQGSDSLRCDKLGESPERTADGWIHWIVTQGPGVTEAELVLGGSGSGTYEPTKYGPVVEFFTPYFDVATLTAILYYEGTLGRNSQFTISDYCQGAFEELTVSKTAVTSFTREHFWDIDKSVQTEEGYELDGVAKIWLYADGTGDEIATWTIDVTYKDYEDDDFNVSGVITVENTGTLDAVITAVDDVLAGTSIDVDCDVPFPYTLEVGKTLTCTYDEDGLVEGDNEVTVTTERDEYFADAEIVWGDPTTEINKTVNIQDVSDLDPMRTWDPLIAEDGTFGYAGDFKWADYGADGCGSFTYDNTATIVETGQEAEATLKVNVQCFVFEGETAWAANEDVPLFLRYVQPGDWATYVQYSGVEKDTTLFAGQTIEVGSVNFSVPDEGFVTITVTLTGEWEFEDVAENLMVQDYAEAPSGNPAPGLFDHKTTCDSEESVCEIVVPENNYYGVHANVGQWIPDPSFGP